MTYRLPLPYKSQAKKRKSDALMTMNIYRNMHHQSLHAFKKKYGQIIIDALPEHTQFNCVKVTYTLYIIPTKGNPTKKDPYRNSKPKNIDLTNILSMVDKVNLDILVQENYLVDDTIEYVQQVVFNVKPYASESFIEVTIEEIIPEPDIRKDNHEN